jgi:hypothetical protein
VRPRRDRDRWKPYKSGLEHAVAEDMKRKGIEFRYEPETLQYRKRIVKGVCDACGGDKTSQRCTYLPDFVVGYSTVDGRATIYIETKGRLTASDRAKMVAVKRDNPGLDIRFIFGADNKLQKNKNERYSNWAEKHGFPFHVGSDFPVSWTEERQLRGVGGSVQGPVRLEESGVGRSDGHGPTLRRRKHYKRRKGNDSKG